MSYTTLWNKTRT